MPRLIDPGPVGPPLALGDAVAAIAAMRFDPRDPGSWDEAAPILARLSANREFLGARAVDALAGRGAGGLAHYGPQVLMLHDRPGRWFLRANMWPAADDPLLLASGREAFFYDVPHDHNFSFLTIGHHGPGYVSAHWTYDASGVVGLPDEPVALSFAGRHQLRPCTMMLYRARIDVHDQKPPAAFSVSLNLMEADARERWDDQYRFDVGRGRIAGVLNRGATEALVALAAHLGGEEGRGLVEDVAARHPVDRIRFGAIRALAGAATGEAARRAILEKAAGRCDSYVAPLAARALARADAIARWSASAP